MNRPILVIGHRNPDTDSICSAIAYAYLKNALGTPAIPARAGNINLETKFVLKHFNVPTPKLIEDLYPRAKDLKLIETKPASTNHTLRDLGKMLREQTAKAIPIVNEEKVVGIITVSDLANRYYEKLNIENLGQDGVNYFNILKTLHGELICGAVDKNPIQGKIKIATADTANIKYTVGKDDLVIIGNRVEAQLECLRAGITGMIIVDNHPVNERVVAMAQSTNTIIIKSYEDTFATAHKINQSVNAEVVMKKDFVAFKSSDLIDDIRKKMVSTGHRSYPVLKNGVYQGMLDRGSLMILEKPQVILIDHNEESQAVEGIEQAHILEIVDHHRLGGLTTNAPIFIRHDPVGSSATIISNMIWHRGVNMPKEIAGLLLSAIISDTLCFRSPTSTPTDYENGKKLAEIAEIQDLESFAMQLLKHGSALSNFSNDEIVRNDLKEFVLGESKISVSQINVLDRAAALKRTDELLLSLTKLRERQGFDFCALMMTDIVNKATDLLFSGDDIEPFVEAFGDSVTANMFYLPGVMSRKKQIIPPLADALSKYGGKRGARHDW